jgi:hypothetical protein
MHLNDIEFAQTPHVLFTHGIGGGAGADGGLFQ